MSAGMEGSVAADSFESQDAPVSQANGSYPQEGYEEGGRDFSSSPQPGESAREASHPQREPQEEYREPAAAPQREYGATSKPEYREPAPQSVSSPEPSRSEEHRAPVEHVEPKAAAHFEPSPAPAAPSPGGGAEGQAKPFVVWSSAPGSRDRGRED